MKKIIVLSLTLFLTACAPSGNIDITDRNHYGLKCTQNAKSNPNWEICMESAKQICGVQQVANVKQLSPTGSGDPNDSYFMTFSCH